MSKVLLTFYSRGGSTEKLALAAAVGAVQARASIRLRRLPDVIPAKTIEEFPECKETLERMYKEYVAPAETDVLWADALILAAPPHFSPSSAEWTVYMELLARLRSEGKLNGKVGATLGNEFVAISFSTVILQLGLIAVPPVSDVEGALAQGRLVATVARALKQD
jgi:NAD(P)H dehydrogenase (quinone)